MPAPASASVSVEAQIETSRRAMLDALSPTPVDWSNHRGPVFSESTRFAIHAQAPFFLWLAVTPAITYAILYESTAGYVTAALLAVAGAFWRLFNPQ